MLLSEIAALAQAHGYTDRDMGKAKALVSVTRPGGSGRSYALALCDSLTEAEDLIELYEWADAEGVEAGHYSIDWPCVFTARYNGFPTWSRAPSDEYVALKALEQALTS